MHTPIPDIPGVQADRDTAYHLSERVSELCQLRGNKFPGSQPVSFSSSSLELLETMNFWVCEKSDGVRVLVFVVMNGGTGEQEVWLIDRKQRYFGVAGLHFPHWESMDLPLTDTIIDGELVTDIDPKTGEATLRFYAFDCLVVHGENIMSKSLEKRFGRLKMWIVDPFLRALKDFPEWKETLPFDLTAKKQELSYHIKQVLDVHVPALQHGHDGLIFTCSESAYVPGTDEKILKWKPPSENSIDFKLELRFPPSTAPHEPDMTAKPIFLLHTWLGGNDYEFFDELEVEDDEWERMKESGEQYDDRIIECCWSTDIGAWRMMRARDDKPHANHVDIMRKIMVSIQDGVEIEALLSRSDHIRAAWKARAGAQSGGRQQGQGRPVPAAAPVSGQHGRGGGGAVPVRSGVAGGGLRR